MPSDTLKIDASALTGCIENYLKENGLRSYPSTYVRVINVIYIFHKRLHLEVPVSDLSVLVQYGVHDHYRSVLGLRYEKYSDSIEAGLPEDLLHTACPPISWFNNTANGEIDELRRAVKREVSAIDVAIRLERDRFVGDRLDKSLTNKNIHERFPELQLSTQEVKNISIPKRPRS